MKCSAEAWRVIEETEVMHALSHSEMRDPRALAVCCHVPLHCHRALMFSRF